MQIKKLAVVAGTVGAVALTLLTAGPASADYAPSNDDAVVVGSDTLQYAVDFIADGDALGNAGYNSSGFINKLVNFDATADANARQAYGPDGKTATPGSAACAPGTGTNKGTINQTTKSTGNATCQLNPTVVLRSGLRPVQRPNGSGAGRTALVSELTAGVKYIDAARSSSAQASNYTSVAAKVATVTIGTEKLAVLTATTTNAPAGGFTKSELASLYSTNVGGDNPFVAGTDTLGCPTWTQLASFRGLSTTGVSTNTIIPLVPQTGSGTRDYWTQQLGGGTAATAIAVGTCTQAVEENDPEAIASSGTPADAIEPMSGARLNMYLGLDGAGASTGLKYFTDPSCQYGSTSTTGSTAGNCGSAIVAGSGNMPVAQDSLVDVALQAAAAQQDTAPFTRVRSLYVHIRKDELASTKQFQPGINQNLVRTLFANPCEGLSITGQNYDVNKTGCVTIGGVQYGVGGQPFFATSAGKALISSAGITSGYTYTNTPI